MAETRKIRRTIDSPIRYGTQDVAHGDEIEVPKGVAGELVRGGGWAFVKLETSAEAAETVAASDSPTTSRRPRGTK